jgi:hypothetical protein
MTTTRETLKAIHERGDLLPWLNGETECVNCNSVIEHPGFNCPPDHYTFRPKPAPPKLRPWTWDEFWPHRDTWFSTNRCVWTRIERIDTPSAQRRLFIHDGWIDLITLMEKYEHLAADGQTWLPCGIVE